MNKIEAQNKIIWSLDPFQSHPQVFQHSVNLLQFLSQGGKVPIEPVYVANPGDPNVVLEFDIPEDRRFQEVVQREMTKVLQGVSVPSLLPPKILVEKHLALSSLAKALARYAEAEKAAIIVVGTQAKKGISKIILGSFTEALLHESKIPLLLVGPNIIRLN